MQWGWSAELTPVSCRPEVEAAALQRLCRRARAGKEAAAARFYREEGNRLFGRRQYGAAVRLYSQVRGTGAAPGTGPHSLGPLSKDALMRGSLLRALPAEAAAPWSPQAASHELPGSPEVSLCFANRSAALFHLECFEVNCGGETGPAWFCPHCRAPEGPQARLHAQSVASGLGCRKRWGWGMRLSTL